MKVTGLRTPPREEFHFRSGMYITKNGRATRIIRNDDGGYPVRLDYVDSGAMAAASVDISEVELRFETTEDIQIVVDGD